MPVLWVRIILYLYRLEEEVKYLLLLLLTGCSIEIKGLKSKEQIKQEEEVERLTRLEKLQERCRAECAPYRVIAVDPRSYWGCTCEARQ